MAIKVSNNVVIDNNGAFALGISSAGESQTTAVKTLNFVGAGNTFAVNGSTVDISIAGGGGGGGVDQNETFSNSNTISTDIQLTESNKNYGLFGPITVEEGVTVTVGASNSFTIV